MEVVLNKYRLSKYFNLPPMRQTERQERLAAEDKYHTNTHTIVNNLFLFGLEVEVEQVPEPRIKATSVSYWNLTQDNSLRNHGVEFVSEPLRGNQIEKALRQLNFSLPPTYEFSPRTSVHVHMNVRDLTVSEILSLVIVYTSIEDLLFKWVGHDRDKNVFCIKLTETEYVKMFLQFMNNPMDTVHNWNKYTALNLQPIQEKGTVEFRHMYGTNDIKTLITWINFLSCLKLYVKSHSFHEILTTICNLNSNSNYEVYLSDIFGKLLEEFNIKDPQEYQHIMEENVSYVKLTNIQIDNQTFQESRTQPTVEITWGNAPQEPQPEIQPFEQRIGNAEVDRRVVIQNPRQENILLNTERLNQIYHTYINNTGRGTL